MADPEKTDVKTAMDAARAEREAAEIADLKAKNAGDAADDGDEDEIPALDETVPGGRYLVAGQMVDADGKALNEAPPPEPKTSRRRR